MSIIAQVVNRYAGRCVACGTYVPAGEGTATKWRGDKRYQLTCTACTSTPEQHVTVFSSGHRQYTNARGRCIDAPCCGCCTV